MSDFRWWVFEHTRQAMFASVGSFIFIGTCIGILLSWLIADKAEDVIAFIVRGFMFGLFVGIFGMVVFSGVNHNHIIRDAQTEGFIADSREIVALAARESVSGNISVTNYVFLNVTGTIDSKSFYNFMYKKDNGSFVMDKVESANLEIYENDAEKPRYEEWHYRYADPRIRAKLGEDLGWTPSRRFYVPVGTVQQSFEIKP